MLIFFHLHFRYSKKKFAGQRRSRSFLSRLFRYAVERRLWLHEGVQATQGCHLSLSNT